MGLEAYNSHDIFLAMIVDGYCDIPFVMQN
jgi:hypothetical protein